MMVFFREDERSKMVSNSGRPGEEFREDGVDLPDRGTPGPNPADTGRPGEAFREDGVDVPEKGTPGPNPPNTGRPGEDFREE